MTSEKISHSTQLYDESQLSAESQSNATFRG